MDPRQDHGSSFRRGGGPFGERPERIELALQFARLGRFFGWSDEEMMRLSSRKIAAYFRQIQRLEAIEDMRTLRVLTAPNSKDALRDLQSDLMRAARGEEKKETTITNQAELSAFLNKAMRGE
jgi:hypothetical protein